MVNRVAILKLLIELVRSEVITERMAQDLERNLNDGEQEPFDAFLLDEGLVSKEDLLKALSRVYQVPCIDVEGYFFQTHLLQMFPQDFLMRNALIPMEQDGNVLIVVATDPADPQLLASIGEHVSYDIQFYVGLYQDILDAIEEYYDPALTEHVDEDEEIRIQDLDDLPVEEEDRDQDILIKEKIDEFGKSAAELEHDE